MRVHRVAALRARAGLKLASLYGDSMVGNGVSKVFSRRLPRAVEEAG